MSTLAKVGETWQLGEAVDRIVTFVYEDDVYLHALDHWTGKVMPTFHPRDQRMPDYWRKLA